MAKSVFGLEENIVAALANATFGIFGVVALVAERESKLVRFHGLQSVITFFGLGIISGIVNAVAGIVGRVPIIGWMVGLPMALVGFALGLATVVAWAYLSYTAFKGRMVKVPFVGDAVAQRLEKHAA